MKRIFLLTALVLGLAACTEESQELHVNSNANSNAGPSTPAYEGTGTNFVAAGWTPGDRNSWFQALKVRTQRGQNEIPRIH